MTIRYPRLPLRWTTLDDQMFLVSQSLNGVLDGQTNNDLELTLTANATTTELLDDRIHLATVPVLVPRTPSAAAAVVSFAATKGKVTLTHDSSAATDRTFAVLLCA